MHYRVNWGPLFKDLFKKAIFIFSGVFVALLVLNVLKSDFNFTEAFAHMELDHIPVIVLIIIIASFFVSSIVAFALQASSITITDTEIRGRNYFGFKQVLTFSQVSKAFHQDDRGYEHIVLYGGGFFKSIHFPALIEKLEEIEEKLNKKGIKIEE